MAQGIRVLRVLFKGPMSKSFQGSPVAETTYLFKELYIETTIRNPTKVGLCGYRQGILGALGVQGLDLGVYRSAHHTMA